MNDLKKKIIITTGDVNGIGAEITIKALNELSLPKDNVVLVSNSNVLNFYGKLKTDYEIIEIDFDLSDITPGKVTQKSGDFSFRVLSKACELLKSGYADALVTAPVSKETLYLAGHNFNGQTEILQEFLSGEGQRADMLFVADDFRVLLLTRHVAIKDIKLDKKSIVEQIVNLDKFFKANLGYFEPKFALCALNPHAGEGGILGREEIEILCPSVEALRENDINITYPQPADTLFINAAKNYLKHTLQPYDCYIACYHDQGLIPIKSVASDKTVNMTIGLDFIRTSPCHGTAFDIAGKNTASAQSMIQAINVALKN